MDVLRLLEADGATVAYHDPFVPTVTHEDHEVMSVPLTEHALADADAVVILTDHSAFDYGSILKHAKVLVDARNATRHVSGASLAAGTPRWIVKV